MSLLLVGARRGTWLGGGVAGGEVAVAAVVAAVAGVAVVMVVAVEVAVTAAVEILAEVTGLSAAAAPSAIFTRDRSMSAGICRRRCRPEEGILVVLATSPRPRFGKTAVMETGWG